MQLSLALGHDPDLPPPADPAILFVDDDDTIRRVFARSMQERGFVVDDANDGESAFRMAEERPYSAAVVDFRLVDEDGLAVIRRLRHIQPDLFCVVVSGVPNLQLPHDPATDARIASVVRKPWDCDELESSIRMAIRMREERQREAAESEFRVLLVEDNAADATLVNAYLAEGAIDDRHLHHAERLGTALSMLATEEFDLALVDLSLPDARGLDAVRRIRLAARDTPLIVLSGVEDDAYASQAMRLGAQDYLNKGTLDPETLSRAIQYAVERKRSEASLRSLAHFDQLTGIANRTLFMERLSGAAARAHRTRKPCAVLLLDLDGFKGINDRRGHAAGDDVLRCVARRLKRVLREPDVPARLGGDEFAVLLDPAESDGTANVVASRIQQALADAMEIDGQTESVAASVGIAVFGEHGTTPKELVAAADEAMYAAKRDRKQRHAEPTPAPSGRTDLRLVERDSGAPVANPGTDRVPAEVDEMVQKAIRVFGPPDDAGDAS